MNGKWNKAFWLGVALLASGLHAFKYAWIDKVSSIWPPISVALVAIVLAFGGFMGFVEGNKQNWKSVGGVGILLTGLALFLQGVVNLTALFAAWTGGTTLVIATWPAQVAIVAFIVSLLGLGGLLVGYKNA